MNREELKELGLNDEQINSVMASHGKTVNSIKDKADKVDGLESQIDDYKKQLKDRDEQLEELSEKAKGNEDLLKQIQDLQKANDDKQKEFDVKLSQQRKEAKLELALKDAKAKDVDLIKVKLDADTIKLNEDGSLVGLKEQLEKLQESHSYLFGEDDKLGGRDPHIPNQQSTELTKEQFASMNYSEKAQLYQENPDLYNQLK